MVDEPEYVEFNAAAGTRLGLFPTRAAAGAGHTLVTFEVDDVERVVQDSEAKGWSSKTTTCRISGRPTE